MASSDPSPTQITSTIWNISRPRPACFVGRQRVLDHLAQAFGASGSGPLVQVLAGGLGMGKSALALEWAYSRRGEYDLVWWIRAESPASIATDLTTLAARLDPNSASIQDANQASLIVRRLLAQRQRWPLHCHHSREQVNPNRESSS